MWNNISKKKNTCPALAPKFPPTLMTSKSHSSGRTSSRHCTLTASTIRHSNKIKNPKPSPRLTPTQQSSLSSDAFCLLLSRFSAYMAGQIWRNHKVAQVISVINFQVFIIQIQRTHFDFGCFLLSCKKLPRHCQLNPTGATVLVQQSTAVGHQWSTFKDALG